MEIKFDFAQGKTENAYEKAGQIGGNSGLTKVSDTIWLDLDRYSSEERRAIVNTLEAYSDD